MKRRESNGSGNAHMRRRSGWKTVLQAALASAAALSCQASSVTITDPSDLGDANGDIRTVRATVQGNYMIFNMSVQGLAGPTPEQTAEGMVNRYYYHWLLDTDNNPATGRSNAEYENNPTGLTKPIGAERVIMVGWRDGKPNGVEVYDPLDEETPLGSGFSFLPSGNSLTAVVPLSALGVVPGQTVALSAFQEGASEGWKVDWVESATLTVESPANASVTVTDPSDLGDTAGDIKDISARAIGDHLVLSMSVHGIAAPGAEQTLEGMVNRYYYHWLLDTDNNPATGRSNAEYENNPTGVTKPVGTERVIMIGWRDGKPNGIELYDPLDDETAILSGFPFQARGNTLTAIVPFSALGVIRGQTVAVSAFQEGASEDWKVDWVESQVLTLDGPNPPIAVVSDPTDLGDTSGDIRRISAHVEGGDLHLTMTVQGLAGPAVGAIAEGMVNRYYYHWLLDTDNNPATGRSNAEYENNSTGLTKPIGAERVIMIGWRDGKPNGVAVYDPLDEENPIALDFPFHASGNTLSTAIPLSTLGLTAGQTIAVSAFQEGASEDWKVDWLESATLNLDAGVSAGGQVVGIDDPADLPDLNGDLKRIEATVKDGKLVLRMSAHGNILPTVAQTAEGKVNRHYYHWLLDTDNNPATGRSNAEYENNPTGVVKPVGSELVIMIGWRNGAVEGREVYNPLDEDNALVRDFAYTLNNGVVEIQLPLSQLGLVEGQTIGVSAFQEGQSDGWLVDWMESATITLSEGPAPTLVLESVFDGDPYGFQIVLTDAGANIANASTVELTLDGAPITAQVTKTGGVTKIVGKHPSLLTAETIHTIGLSIAVGGVEQSRNFVFEVPKYTVLPLAGRLQSPHANSGGFTAHFNAVSSFQHELGGITVHSNLATLAEGQLAGTLKPEGSDSPYYNELDPAYAPGKGPAFVVPGVINWFEFAPDQTTPINFPADQPFPVVLGVPADGTVAEIVTYLDLAQGSHKLGLYTEGGHKVTAGLDGNAPVLSIFDNSGDVARIPSYFARNQFFDVVAPVAGLYPIRILWFQSRKGQEPGLILEFFSVKDRTLHLVNDSSDPLAIKAYRSGVPVDPNSETPTLSLAPAAGGVSVSWTGRLQASDRLQGGTWTVIGEANQSPMTIPTTGAARFFRATR